MTHPLSDGLRRLARNIASADCLFTVDIDVAATSLRRAADTLDEQEFEYDALEEACKRVMTDRDKAYRELAAVCQERDELRRQVGISTREERAEVRVAKLEAVAEVAASVLSEEGVKEYLSSWCMGVELIDRLAALEEDAMTPEVLYGNLSAAPDPGGRTMNLADLRKLADQLDDESGYAKQTVSTLRKIAAELEQQRERLGMEPTVTITQSQFWEAIREASTGQGGVLDTERDHFSEVDVHVLARKLGLEP